jgi:hypothetical protein
VPVAVGGTAVLVAAIVAVDVLAVVCVGVLVMVAALVPAGVPVAVDTAVLVRTAVPVGAVVLVAVVTATWVAVEATVLVAGAGDVGVRDGTTELSGVIVAVRVSAAVRVPSVAVGGAAVAVGGAAVAVGGAAVGVSAGVDAVLVTGGVGVSAPIAWAMAFCTAASAAAATSAELFTAATLSPTTGLGELRTASVMDAIAFASTLQSVVACALICSRIKRTAASLWKSMLTCSAYTKARVSVCAAGLPTSSTKRHVFGSVPVGSWTAYAPPESVLARKTTRPPWIWPLTMF